MTDQPKSMGLFFIDNLGAWPKGARQVGDLVVWADTGIYPTGVPIASAAHPAFDGRVVMQAVARGLVLSFVHGASTTDDVMKALSKLPASATPDGAKRFNVCQVTQHRVAVDAIINRVVLDMYNQDDADALSAAHPFALLKALAAGSPKEADLLVRALKTYMRHGDVSKDALAYPQAWQDADDMLSNLEAAVSASSNGAAPTEGSGG